MSIRTMEATTTVVCEVRKERLRERIITARLVPYGETSYNVPDPGGERFLHGSLSKTLDAWAQAARPLKLFRAHQHHEAVALASGYEPDAPGGPLAEFRLGRTAAADQVLDEIDQGLLDSVSVGFHTLRERRGRDGVREILEAALIEASILPLGAYDGAQVLAVRAPAAPAGAALDLARFALPPAPSVDPDAPLWAGLR